MRIERRESDFLASRFAITRQSLLPSAVPICPCDSPRYYSYLDRNVKRETHRFIVILSQNVFLAIAQFTVQLSNSLKSYHFTNSIYLLRQSTFLTHPIYKFVRLSTSYNQIAHLTSVLDILPIQPQNNSPLNQLTFINVERQQATDLLNAPYTSRSDRHATQSSKRISRHDKREN